MAGLVFIEVLGAKDRVTERFRVGSFPLTIGRAYTNDIIIDDPYVCPEHLRVVQDAEGNVVAEDRGSRNGLREGDRPEPVSSVRIYPGTRLRIGHTVLHFCDSDRPVPPAVPDRPDSGTLWSGLLSPYAAIGFSIAAFVWLAGYSYLGTYERVSVAKVVSQSLFILLALGLWAGCWSLVSRIVFGKSNYTGHLAVVCGVFLVYTIFDVAVEWLEFAFVAEQTVWLLGIAVGILSLAMLLAGHLLLASNRSRKTIRWWSIGVSSAIVGLIVVADYADRDKFTFMMQYSAVLKPMSSRWVPAVSVEQFVNDAQGLKTEVEALAQKARRKD